MGGTRLVSDPAKTSLAINDPRIQSEDARSRVATLSQNLDEAELLFVEFYLQTFNARRSATMAGLVKDSDSEREQWLSANRILNVPEVARVIEAKLEASVMGAPEILARLSGQARADVSMFMKTSTNKDGLEWDWEAIRDNGWLIKKMTRTRYGLQLELYSAQDALTLIGRHLSLFKDVTEHDGQITVKALQAWQQVAAEQLSYVDELEIEDETQNS